MPKKKKKAVVKPIAKLPPGTRILVPLDGSPVAEKALSSAEQMALALQTQVLLMQVALPLRAAIVASHEVVSPDEAEPLRDERLNEYMGQLAVDAIERGCEAEYEVCPVPASQALLEETRARLLDLVAQQILDRAAKSDVGMIVMATHGHSARRGTEYGGVAARVLAGSSKPVLLVRVLP